MGIYTPSPTLQKATIPPLDRDLSVVCDNSHDARFSSHQLVFRHLMEQIWHGKTVHMPTNSQFCPMNHKTGPTGSFNSSLVTRISVCILCTTNRQSCLECATTIVHWLLSAPWPVLGKPHARQLFFELHVESSALTHGAGSAWFYGNHFGRTSNSYMAFLLAFAVNATDIQ